MGLKIYGEWKVSMSYSGGTARGRQLAREFDRRGLLNEFFVPSYSCKVDYCPASFIPLLFGEQEVDPRKIRTSFWSNFVRELLSRTAGIRRAKPTERYRYCEAVDKSVARRLRSGADLLMAEAQIALHTLRRAKELGMITVLDRTNSHIAYQSEVWTEEHRRFGIEWIPNSERVIQKGLQEYEEADYIFALSSYARRTFIERGIPEEKVFCVPSGIDLVPFRQIEKEDDVFRVIYCGIIHVKKGIHYLLQAFDELKLKNAELWLIGAVGKGMFPLLERYRGRYRHLGYISYTELFRYYSQGSVFVLPSLEEGLAKVLIEAMACGLPVIATVNTGAEDVVRKGLDGFIVPIRDVEALKEKMTFMYEDEERRREMGQQARVRVQDEFTLERYVERMLHTIEGISHHSAAMTV